MRSFGVTLLEISCLQAKVSHTHTHTHPYAHSLPYGVLGQDPVRNSWDFPISLADLQLTQQTYVSGGRAACQGRHVQPRETSHCSGRIFGQLRQLRAARELGKMCESGGLAGCPCTR
ncbi:hypothetical protein HOLleu_28326 [Holothuria leucospilota]|uniref:Uncharacterized protein n=1 Tax=Holothuria leucospilota TaxID=206669 RepID=A0A9Q1BLW5_HOLLE|nr:hypothetical protein HOLleu_28326 [Holothuria leucospilota]